MKHPVRVVVLCTNSEGAPEFHGCVVPVTTREEADGEHYVLAKRSAGDLGFTSPMIAFSRGDPAYDQLADILAWS